MWTFIQKTGNLYQDGILKGAGYSGRGIGLLNPNAESLTDIGPIPVGLYVIGDFQDHPHLGSLVAPLTPLPGTETYHRDGFFIHGDNALLNYTASEGCVILSHVLRLTISESQDKNFEVKSYAL